VSPRGRRALGGDSTGRPARYLTKPLRIDDLATEVYRVLDGVDKGPTPESTAPLSTSIEVPLEVAVALRYAGGDRQLLDELAEMFVHDAPERLSTLRDALQKGDTEAADRTAHSLKGALAMFGAHRSAALARDIEALCHAGLLEKAGELRDSLETHVALVLDVLRATPWRIEA